MSRKVADALPGGESDLRVAVWQFMRPMLSPALVDLNRDAFTTEHHLTSTVDLDAYRATSDLDELDLDETGSEAA